MKQYICNICNLKFIDKKSSHRKYCSRQCYSKARSIIYVGDNATHFKGGNVKVLCSNCKKEFFVKHHKSKNKDLYCSVPCSLKNKKGILSRNWQGGKSFEDYPITFTNELKEEIRNRDDRSCTICGMEEHIHLFAFGDKLNIHHIDYNKQNCSKDNLITLCRRCNASVNSNRKLWTENLQFHLKYMGVKNES